MVHVVIMDCVLEVTREMAVLWLCLIDWMERVKSAHWYNPSYLTRFLQIKDFQNKSEAAIKYMYIPDGFICNVNNIFILCTI